MSGGRRFAPECCCVRSKDCMKRRGAARGALSILLSAHSIPLCRLHPPRRAEALQIPAGSWALGSCGSLSLGWGSDGWELRPGHLVAAPCHVPELVRSAPGCPPRHRGNLP